MYQHYIHVLQPIIEVLHIMVCGHCPGLQLRGGERRPGKPVMSGGCLEARLNSPSGFMSDAQLCNDVECGGCH